MKEKLEAAPHADPSIAAGEYIASELAPESLFKTLEPHGYLEVPDYLGGGESTALPAVRGETHRGNVVDLVCLAPTNSRLEKLMDQAKGPKDSRQAEVTKMFFDAAIRLVDIPGANGLHHYHQTAFPGTVYHTVKRRRDVYLTTLGETEDNVPVIGWITATDGEKGRREFFKAVNAGNQKRRYNAKK